MTSAVPIAVVGIACRFPGADSVRGFCDLLCRGQTAIAPIPPERDLIRTPSKPFAALAGLLPGIETFDRHPFRLSATDAPLIDPQQRLALETAWHALEDAGLAPAGLSGLPIGVFVGASSAEHALRLAETRVGLGNPHLPNAAQNGAVSGRISYCLGLTGPSITVDTACSSSLVAVGLAGDALRLGQCDIALAGGVNALSAADGFSALAATGMLSVRGETRPFDAAADGFVRAEGAGMLVLKRLPDAIAAGDLIHAVLAGWATGHNGRSNGLGAPFRDAQVQVIRRAQRAAGLLAEDIGAIEAHGTATPLGDSVEALALADVFATRQAAPLWLGAVKATLGHLEAAAGIASLIKAILMLRHTMVPVQPGFATPSARIDWAKMPFAIPLETQGWTQQRRAVGVSAFGMSGQNAHVIVTTAEDSPCKKAPDDGSPSLFLLSAVTPAALAARSAQLVQMLSESPAPLKQLANAVSRRWAGLALRAQFLASSHEEAIAAATAIAAAPPTRPVVTLGKAALAEADLLAPDDLRRLCRTCPDLAETTDSQAGALPQIHAPNGPRFASALLALHAAGLAFRPHEAFPAATVQQDLPGYPFDRVRCLPTPKQDETAE